MNEQLAVKEAINAFYKGAGLNIKFTGDANQKVAEIFGNTKMHYCVKLGSKTNWRASNYCLGSQKLYKKCVKATGGRAISNMRQESYFTI